MATVIHPKEIYREVFLMSILSLTCVALYILRTILSDSPLYLFLNWNLFLATVPWVFTTLLLLRPGLQKRKLVVFSVLASWLLFFPNAPYILTDLFHIRKITVMPLWFDLVLILFYAWTGLMFGYLSLHHLERIFSSVLSVPKRILFTTFMFFIVAFGIYMGRYLRWNSWDLLSNPKPLLYDIGVRILYPFDHLHTWGMTFLMGLFLIILYWSLKYIRTNRIAP